MSSGVSSEIKSKAAVNPSNYVPVHKGKVSAWNALHVDSWVVQKNAKSNGHHQLLGCNSSNKRALNI